MGAHQCAQHRRASQLVVHLPLLNRLEAFDGFHDFFVVHGLAIS